MVLLKIYHIIAMNKIERLAESLHDAYEKEYQRLLDEDWDRWKKTGKRLNDTEQTDETKWEYKGDTY